jgi:hypothetical protein
MAGFPEPVKGGDPIDTHPDEVHDYDQKTTDDNVRTHMLSAKMQAEKNQIQYYGKGPGSIPMPQ